MVENINKLKYGQIYEKVFNLKNASKLKVRTWILSDLPKVYNWILEFKETDYNLKNMFRLTEKIFISDLQNKMSNINILVSEIIDSENPQTPRIVGVCFYAYTFLITAGPSLYVELQYVNEDMRGKGISKMMLISLLELCRVEQMNAVHIVVSKNEPELCLYWEKIGFLPRKYKTFYFVSTDILDKLSSKSNILDSTSNAIKSSFSVKMWKESDCSVVQQLMVQSAKEQGITEFRISKETLLDAGFGSTPPTCYCFLVEAALDNGKLTAVGYCIFSCSYDLSRGKTFYVDDLYLCENNWKAYGILVEMLYSLNQFAISKGCEFYLGIIKNSFLHELIQNILPPICSEPQWIHYELMIT